MTSTHTGIIHRPRGKTTTEWLLLEDVRVKAWIVDVSSRIVLTQTFSNPSDEPTGKAKYIFPLPANAAVCAFELELEDGSVVVGEVKKKERAAPTFTHASQQEKIADGRKHREATLAITNTDIVLRCTVITISIGSIPAATKVVAHLTFVMDLLDGTPRDHVRMQLPMHIAQRHGPLPVMMNNTFADSRTRIDISVDVQTSGAIHGIRSPTHHITLRHYKGRSGRKSQRRMSAVWKATKFLTNDFVITIHAEGLDKPRCFAEVQEAESSEKTSIAMQLTLIPKFPAPQEYIFILDRSKSMKNAPIEIGKQTLMMLLHLLPTTHTMFNMFSFGDTVTSLWESSRTVDPTSLKNATSYIATMRVDHGGKEVHTALQSAFNSRGLDRPAVVFLLTDGKILARENLDTWMVISNAVRHSPTQASVRLFVLGIGTGASSSICSRLAQQGNGAYLPTPSAEDIFGACARLLNAERWTKCIEHIRIDWAYDSSSPPVNILTPSHPPSLAQQAPHSLTKVLSGIQLAVFAITSFKAIPTSIRLIVKLDGVSEPQELTIDVTKVKPFQGTNAHSIVPIIHTQAARKLVMESEDRAGRLPTLVRDDTLLAPEDALVIVRLGLAYQLATKHTCFVAAHKGDGPERNRGRTSVTWARHGPTDPDDPTLGIPEAPPTCLDGFITGASALITSVLCCLATPTRTTATATHATLIADPDSGSGSDSWPWPVRSDASDSGSTTQTRSRRYGRTSRSTPNHSDGSRPTLSTLSSLEPSTWCCGACTCTCPSSSSLSSLSSHSSRPSARTPSPAFCPTTDTEMDRAVDGVLGYRARGSRRGTGDGRRDCNASPTRWT